MGKPPEEDSEKVLKRLGLLLRTARYLKAEQAMYLAKTRVPTGLLSLGLRTGLGDSAVTGWKMLKPRVPFPCYPWWIPENLRSGRFDFIGRKKTFLDVLDWASEDMPLLWRYNLHYFQFLLPDGGLDADTGGKLIREWVRHNPIRTPVAWDPFPLSLRVVNWAKYLSLTEHAPSFQEEAARSLFQQIRYLEGNLERHLLANHLFKNIKALLFAGVSFDRPEAARWREQGLGLLRRELAEQILPDGGHFERSPMYHCMIFEDCLDLLNIAHCFPMSIGSSPENELREVCGRMAGFLAGTLHPDGDIPLFNDSAFGIELPPRRLLQYASELGVTVETDRKRRHFSFPDTGYYIFSPGEDSRLIVDCGPIGPDYQPGHAHCDTLSYELSLSGRRVVVDSGVYGYEPGDLRSYVRSTSAHNTVEVDGTEQSEIWKSHRVGRRAKPLSARIEGNGAGAVSFAGSHDGYSFLPGKVIHERTIRYEPQNNWMVLDRILGKGNHGARSRIHLHPDLRPVVDGERVLILDSSQRTVAELTPVGTQEVLFEKGWYCPRFGLRKGKWVIAFEVEGELPLEVGYWFRT